VSFFWYVWVYFSTMHKGQTTNAVLTFIITNCRPQLADALFLREVHCWLIMQGNILVPWWISFSFGCQQSQICACRFDYELFNGAPVEGLPPNGIQWKTQGHYLARRGTHTWDSHALTCITAGTLKCYINDIYALENPLKAPWTELGWATKVKWLISKVMSSVLNK